MGLTGFATGAVLALLQPLQEPPTAQPLWTIRNDDCQSVDADGDPWRECGFQSYDMNADGSRVLTQSSLGSVQLWDGAGRQIAKIDWGDEPGGASGFPNGVVRIVGTLGVAVVHQNQLLVLELADGREIARRVLPLLQIRELRVTPNGALLATAYYKDWKLGGVEIGLPGGEIRPATLAEAEGPDASMPWPGGLHIIRAEGAVLLRSAAERTIARLPPAAGICAWQGLRAGSCRITRDGRKLLIAVPVPLGGDSGQDMRADVTLYALPDAGD